MTIIESLTQIFSKFPGIGARQARRFVYFLLSSSNSSIRELITELQKLSTDVAQCTRCFRFFEGRRGESAKPRTAKIVSLLCSTCENPRRGTSRLLIVEKDTDLESVEISGVYDGQFFILGGLVSLTAKESGRPSPGRYMRGEELKKIIHEQASTHGLKEIIVAFGAHPEGDATYIFLRNTLSPLLEKYKLQLTLLGKGLSTGTELEYSDRDTLRAAFENRK